MHIFVFVGQRGRCTFTVPSTMAEEELVRKSKIFIQKIDCRSHRFDNFVKFLDVITPFVVLCEMQFMVARTCYSRDKDQ